ncbi:MAG: 3-oxoacyl-ACP synthase III [Desulfobacteraceae bacterium]|nr:3-oxoacyl-ACP synthase III [Desulfobacteraceae bacterium]
MRYENVNIDAFGYELAPNVVESDALERRLGPLYEQLHLQRGQLETLTGVRERRYWDENSRMSDGAVAAGRKALEGARVSAADIGVLVYGGVCRDNLEPATACAVAHALEIPPDAQVYDLSNACLGVLNGMVHVANAIELGHARAGIVVSCESARQIVDTTIQRLLSERNMESFKHGIATLTGGSGAVAVVLTHRSMSGGGHRLLGATARNATEHHRLCRWGPDTGIPASGLHTMETDSVGVLRHGVVLGVETYRDFRRLMRWSENEPDKIICHQVGAAHQRTILDAIGVAPEKDFVTYPYLGNIGTVSLPITAAIASERGFLETGDAVGFLGIGSGLNCLMLGIQW